MKTYWQNDIADTCGAGGAGRIDVLNPGTGKNGRNRLLPICGVFTRNLNRAATAARQLRAGQVVVIKLKG